MRPGLVRETEVETRFSRGALAQAIGETVADASLARRAGRDAAVVRGAPRQAALATACQFVTAPPAERGTVRALF